MPPPRKTNPTPAPEPEPAADDEPQVMELDAWTFNAAERHECQVQFDTEFGDLLEYLFKVVQPNQRWATAELDADGNVVPKQPTGPLTVAIVDRAGRRWFGDEILQFMLWVQAKRDRPDADLDEFAEAKLQDLREAHIAGLTKKGGTASGRRRRPPRGPAS